MKSLMSLYHPINTLWFVEIVYPVATPHATSRNSTTIPIKSYQWATNLVVEWRVGAISCTNLIIHSHPKSRKRWKKDKTQAFKHIVTNKQALKQNKRKFKIKKGTLRVYVICIYDHLFFFNCKVCTCTERKNVMQFTPYILISNIQYLHEISPIVL
jgi:hypothetical protein